MIVIEMMFVPPWPPAQALRLVSDFMVTLHFLCWLMQWLPFKLGCASPSHPSSRRPAPTIDVFATSPGEPAKPSQHTVVLPPEGVRTPNWNFISPSLLLRTVPSGWIFRRPKWRSAPLFILHFIDITARSAQQWLTADKDQGTKLAHTPSSLR